MNKFVSFFVIVFIINCSIHNKGNEKYVVKYQNNKVEIYFGNKKIKIKKYESKYFDAYIPEIMERRIFNDSLLYVTDKSDTLNDNISIVYKYFPNCNGQDIIESKVNELKSKFILVANEHIEVNKKNGLYLHEMQVDANGKQYKQKCFYKCKSDSGVIMSCLTTSINSYQSKIEIFDLLSDFIFSENII